MPRTYVDNAYNRSVGRVGMSIGTAVISSGGSGGGRSVSSYGGGGGRSYASNSGNEGNRTYVDNSSNRALGRVGLPLGSAVNSSKNSSSAASSSGNRTYVDNSQNRSLGRVGLPVGSAVHSNSNNSSSSHGATKSYVDNEMNRSLGRVGLPLGSAIHSINSMSSTVTRRPSAATIHTSWNMLAMLNSLGELSLTTLPSNTTPISTNSPSLSRASSDSPQSRNGNQSLLHTASYASSSTNLQGSSLRSSSASSTLSARRKSCPICLSDEITYAFSCGHGVCEGCLLGLHEHDSKKCPACRGSISNAIRLFF